ncbi:hypothetical protein [Bordetella genomosp. 9]|uniref:Integrase catalytic domain-containing protein n=1 Tax=Bordetella genomosp. 9 TaxID=1416803 RepID=A0A1W6Z1E5_9BORD|nr:hypothetical protein [Bordetella genomosp. 9]ARP86653.1 hypothetical protein CAL13_10870 [Bordetella genomosp. 9]
MQPHDSDADIEAARRVRGRAVDLSLWATPDEAGLPEALRTLYLARKRAVLLYLSGAPSVAIKQSTSLGAKQVYRLIRERCLATHPDGQPYGWRGLIPYLRLRPYERRKAVHVGASGAGAAGALQAVLDLHPDLREAFDTRIRRSWSSGTRLHEINQSRKRHAAWFLDQLRGLGYEARGEWPFNTVSRGYYSIRRYIDRVLNEDPRALAGVTGGPDLVTKLKTGDGADRPVLKFMQRVEMDAHKLDGRFCVSIADEAGGYKEKIVHRLWVIVLLEVVSRAVIGYYFSLRREVSVDDVLRAIKRALGRWPPRPVSYCKTAYLPGAGLLSSAGEEFVGLCWDETSVDGALAETCATVRTLLRDAVGSALLEPKTAFSKRRSKDDRPFIEAFFRRSAGGGLQRLSNTTGANTTQRKGRQPEEIAVTSRFQYEYAEELLDVVIANYNCTGHKGIGYRTPLAYAKFLYEKSNQRFRRVDADAVESYFSVRRRCAVRGGARTGRMPFVEFYYARYTNETLQNRQDLVGSDIWVICHKEDDCRVVRAATLDGLSLGVLRAAPPWNASPHSLSVRTAICKANARGQFDIPAGSDAIAAFMQYVERQPNKRLPVHPAYLEARRILACAENPFIGDAMLEKAMASRTNGGLKHETHRKPARASGGEGAAAARMGTMTSPLPARRMAKSK